MEFNDIYYKINKINMKSDILEFVCSLHGYLIRLKEIHWSTENNATHKLCDEIMDDVADAEDRIAETSMGLDGKKIKIGELTPYLPNSEELIPMLKELEKETLDLKKKLSKDNEAGITNVLDDILTFVGKYKYRATQK